MGTYTDAEIDLGDVHQLVDSTPYGMTPVDKVDRLLAQ